MGVGTCSCPCLFASPSFICFIPAFPILPFVSPLGCRQLMQQCPPARPRQPLQLSLSLASSQLYSFIHCTALQTCMSKKPQVGCMTTPLNFALYTSFVFISFHSQLSLLVSTFAILLFSYSTCSCFHSRSLVSFQMRLWLTLFLSALIAIVMADYTMVEEQVDIDY